MGFGGYSAAENDGLIKLQPYIRVTQTRAGIPHLTPRGEIQNQRKKYKVVKETKPVQNIRMFVIINQVIVESLTLFKTA